MIGWLLTRSESDNQTKCWCALSKWLMISLLFKQFELWFWCIPEWCDYLGNGLWVNKHWYPIALYNVHCYMPIQWSFCVCAYVFRDGVTLVTPSPIGWADTQNAPYNHVSRYSRLVSSLTLIDYSNGFETFGDVLSDTYIPLRWVFIANPAYAVNISTPTQIESITVKMPISFDTL